MIECLTINTEEALSTSPTENCNSGSEQSRSSSPGDEPIITSPKPRMLKRYPSSPGTRERVLQTQGEVVYTAGRPPWYDVSGEHKTAFVVGLCGGSASGKTTLAERIITALDVPWVSTLSMDSFYKVLTPEQHEAALRNDYNFDHPDAFDLELLKETLERLREGKQVQVPCYNFITHARDAETKEIYGANVVIFEGIMTFCSPEIRELLDMKIFVETDSDVRLARRLLRDISERGRDLDGVLEQYEKYVKPAFEQFIAPTMAYADIIVPWGQGEHNEVALRLIVQHVHTQLRIRGVKLRCKLQTRCSLQNSQPAPASLTVLQTTPQIKLLHTIIRDRKTERDEFIFYSQRLMRLLLETALSLLPFNDTEVITPQSITYNGKRRSAEISCVSIMRAGEAMEPAVMEIVKDIRIGRILIQTNPDTGDPELHYLRLPRDISKHHVLLLDTTVATGAAAMMAVRVLLDHDVPQTSITLCSLIMANTGVHNLAYAFPKLKMVTSAVDRGLDSDYRVVPGIGNFGDRYFGTESR